MTGLGFGLGFSKRVGGDPVPEGTLAARRGSIAYTGHDATLVKSWLDLGNNAGSMSYTGQQATLTYTGSSGITDPTDISNLALWLDASDTSTITHVGGAVSQWDDKEVAGAGFEEANAANQPTTGTRTQNSLNLIDFDGGIEALGVIDVADYSSIPNGNNTLFFFCALDGTTEQRLFSGGVGISSRWAILHNRVSNTTEFVSSTSFSTADVAVTPASGLHLFILVRNGANVTGYVRGASGNGSNTAAVGVNLSTLDVLYLGATPSGGSPYMDGAIGEIIGYSKALTTAEINDVVEYINTKWGASFTTV